MTEGKAAAKSPWRSAMGLFYGMVYGIAHVVPGLSGGTFLVIFGCYDIVCEAFALNFTKIKEHFFFLMLFGIGTVGGLIGFVYAFTFILQRFGLQTNLFFMGLILGSIPLIVRTATADSGITSLPLPSGIVGFALVVALFLAEKFDLFALSGVPSGSILFAAVIFFYSFVAAIAMILPGISGAFVLVAFGVYDLFIEAIKTLHLAVLIPAVVGILVGIVVGAKLILLVLNRYRLVVYAAIVCMVLGSVVPLFPVGLGLNAATLAGVICFVLGGYVAVLMGKTESGNA